MTSPIEQLTDEIRDVALLVHSAQERAEDREIVKNAHLAVERLSVHYRELCSTGSEAERAAIERKLGRRVTDLRRMASTLPRIGVLASEHTGDQASAGPSGVQERRITGVSWRIDQPPRASDFSLTLRVGGEVDSWCGPCDGLTTHHIIAMVDQMPKQVVCQACGGRHGYRTTPARKSPAEIAAQASAPKESEAARRAEQKAEELRALGREVAEAENSRTFNARERYKVGEIISHPDYGRGKVETVLRSSLLVRFPTGGLKSLMLS
jgi:hypothetical protein